MAAPWVVAPHLAEVGKEEEVFVLNIEDGAPLNFLRGRLTRRGQQWVTDWGTYKRRWEAIARILEENLDEPPELCERIARTREVPARIPGLPEMVFVCDDQAWDPPEEGPCEHCQALNAARGRALRWARG